jgi:hypothetical protein
MYLIKNEVPELEKFNRDYYDPMLGYYVIPDTKISEREVEAIVAKHDGWDYLYEDVFFNVEGLPDVGVGSFVVGPVELIRG